MQRATGRGSGGRPRVVVVGAGFGGLNAVRGLRRAPVEVIVVDQHNYHLFTPLLYQVASALLDPSEIAHPVRAILRHQRNARFVMGRMTAVDLDAHVLHTTAGDIAWDRLVVAVGSVNNFFGIESVEARAYPLKELDDALALRGQVLAAFERAAVTHDDAERRRLLSIAVVGGGPTGVECSGAFAELSGLVLRRDYRGSPVRHVDIELLEMAPAVLGTFAPSLQRAALRTLQHKGIDVHLRTGVAALSDDGEVVLRDGSRIEAATVVWTAGVKAAPVAHLLGVEPVQGGRVPVDEWLRVGGRDDVYAIGDVAAVQGHGGPHPMLAPVAIQQGHHVARQLTAEYTGAARPGPFRYFDKGTMATIGRNAAIAEIGPLRVSGFPGWLMWLFIHLVQIVSFRSRVVVLLNWAWDYFLFDRPVRLITGARRRPPAESPPAAEG